MANRKEIRSEETKKAILSAAGTLFAAKGYEAVTMREIAKQANCSHTTIYIYFQDKESLLHELSMPPLRQLQQQMIDITNHPVLTPYQKLSKVSQEIIRFCLTHRSMYSIFFAAKAARVDEEDPELEINQLRNSLFRLLGESLQHCLKITGNDERMLAYSRIYFYTLQGIIGTYAISEEPLKELFERVGPTFELAVQVLVAGFETLINERMNEQ
ncbi:TetR/AcrR family transcriptional regulator [Paenibacillus tarimensis]